MSHTVLWIFIFIRLFSGSSFDYFGFSPRGKICGNELTATSSDYSSIYYNPANLSFLKGGEVAFDLDYYHPNLTIDAEPYDSYPMLLPGQNLSIGVSFATPLGSFFKKRFALGMTLYVPTLRMTRAGSIDFRIPQFFIYNNLNDMLAAIAGFSVKITDHFSAGFGISVFGSLQGTSDVIISIKEQEIVKKEVLLDINPFVTPLGGVSFRTERLFFGLSYRHSLKVRYDLDITVDIQEIGLLYYTLHGISLYSPPHLSIALGYHFIQPFPVLVSMSITYQFWHLLPDPWSKIEMVLDDSHMTDNETGVLMSLHSKGGHFTVQDIPVIGLALEIPFRTFVIRTGYQFRPSIISNQEHDVAYLDSSAHTVSLGLEATTSSGRIGLSFFFSSLEPEKHMINRKISYGGYLIGVGFGITRLIFNE